MAIVAGVDFGTLSVRVSLVDSERGLLESAVAEYPLHRKREDPGIRHSIPRRPHARAGWPTREVLKKAGIAGDQVQAIALDTTGSSVIPVGKDLQPLGEYYLWCDHRAKGEAAEITEAAHREGLGSDQWCGGVYSSEWGFSKLLHWLRHNPDRDRSLFPPSSTATWWRPRSVASPIPESKTQRLRDGAQVAVERETRAAFRRRAF
jgi:L-ribulokinase